MFAYATALTRVTLQVRAVELMAFVDAAARARPVRVDRSQPRARRLRGSAGARRSTSTTARWDRSRAWRIARNSRRRAELLRALPVARAPAVGDAGGRPRDSALPARADGRRLSRRAVPADSPGQLERRAGLLVGRARHHLAGWPICRSPTPAIGVTGSNVMDALRTYLIAQLKAPRCADNVTAAMTPSTLQRRAAARQGRRRRQADRRGRGAATRRRALGVARIDMLLAVRRRRPAARRGGAAAWARRGAVAAARAADRRVAQPGGAAAHRRRTVERQERARPSATTSTRRRVLFTWMLDLMPASPVRTRALRAFVEFLRRTETDVNRRMLWFAFVNRLLEMSRGPFRGEVLDGDGGIASAGAVALRAARAPGAGAAARDGICSRLRGLGSLQ